MTLLRFQCRHRYPSGFELNTTFEANSGVTALFGPSGAGKSTILSLIAGILRPERGHIYLGQRVLVDTSSNIFLPPEERHLGVVFQDHLLFPHLTIKKNLQYGLERAPSRPIDFKRVIEILEIGELMDRYPNTLSGGQRQRTALGRALLRGPELLLMDEPLNSLDSDLKERILTYLERVLVEYHIPTIYVSHDQQDVRRLAERVVIVERGQVVESGPAEVTLERLGSFSTGG